MEHNIQLVLDMFPSLTVDAVKQALTNNRDNVEEVINHFLTGGNADADADGIGNGNGNGDGDGVEGETEEQTNERLLRELLAAEQAAQEEVNAVKLHYCSICLGDLCIDKFYIVDECEHRFCSDCLEFHARRQMDMGFLDIMCPQIGCKRIISYEEVKQILDAHWFERYDKLVLKKCLNKTGNFLVCPQCSVGMEASVIKSDDPNVINNENLVGCPHCNYAFCLECRDQSHINLTCQQWSEVKDYFIQNTEVDNTGDVSQDYVSYKHHRKLNKFWRGGRRWKTQFRKDIESMRCHNMHRGGRADQRALVRWLQSNTQTCPYCQLIIQKDGGCNDMRCTCGNKFCYSCGNKPDYHVANHMKYPCRDDYFGQQNRAL